MFGRRWIHALVNARCPKFPFARSSSFVARREEQDDDLGLPPRIDGSSPLAASVDRIADLLRRCAAARDLDRGRAIHAWLERSGQIHDRFLANLLIVLYGKCGAVEESVRVFQGIAWPNAISWTVLISANAQNGYCREALHFFRAMDLDGISVDAIALSAVIEACMAQKMLKEGREIHAAISNDGILLDNMLKNNLVNMYGKCGCVEDAKLVFDSIQDKSLISWNVMISALGHNERGREVTLLWREMLLQGFKPDRVSFVTFIDVCANLAALDEGVRVHRLVVSQGLESNRIVANTLVNMYGKCEKLEIARDFFERMPSRDAVSWNTMIAGYVLHHHNTEALDLFRLMDLEGVGATKVTFVTALDACWKLGQVKLLHETAVEIGLEVDEVLGRALMNAYRACGSLDEARSVFSDTSSNENVLLWNGLLASFSEQGGESVRVFKHMQQEGVKSDKVTLISVLDSCVALSNLELGKLVHSFVVELGFEQDMYVQTALVNMYGKCGKLDDARNLFDRMSIRDSVTWNAMLSSYTQKGRSLQAIHLFLLMDLEGERLNGVTIARVLDACGSDSKTLVLASEVRSQVEWDEDDVHVGNALLNVYSKAQDREAANDLFERMKNRDVVSFNTVMGSFSQSGMDRDCLRTFYSMQLQGLRPNNISYVTALDACTNLAALASGRAIHESMKASPVRPDLIAETALINMYGKCGNLEVAWDLFEAMSNERDEIAWNAVIAAYAQHGRAEETIKLFWKMQQDGARADAISFLVTVTACGHGGLLGDAIELFASMSRDHGVEPAATHFGCLIDVLGRSSRLCEAEEVIRKVPPRIEVPASWRIFLNACKEQGDDARGKRAAEFAMSVEPGDNMPYLLLSNLFKQK